MPCLIISSEKSQVANDKVLQRFWLSGMDYLSFCYFINCKYFIDKEIESIKYIGDAINKISKYDYENNVVLIDSNKKFYIHIFQLIKNETKLFDNISLYLDNDSRDRNMPLINRKYLNKDIYKEYEIKLSKLSAKSAVKALIMLLYDLDISIFDKDLDILFTNYEIDYIPIRDYLLNNAMIEEMHPQNYCNFDWESNLLRHIDKRLYHDYFINDTRGNKEILDYNKLLFNVDELCDLSRHQRSYSNQGIYLSPLFRSFLDETKFDLKSKNDLSELFVESLEKNLDKYKPNIQKRMIIDSFRTILHIRHRKNVLITYNFDEYIRKLGDVIYKTYTCNYYSYLLKNKFRFKTNYYSIIANEASIFFRGDIIAVYSANIANSKVVFELL